MSSTLGKDLKASTRKASSGLGYGIVERAFGLMDGTFQPCLSIQRDRACLDRALYRRS